MQNINVGDNVVTLGTGARGTVREVLNNLAEPKAVVAFHDSAPSRKILIAQLRKDDVCTYECPCTHHLAVSTLICFRFSFLGVSKQSQRLHVLSCVLTSCDQVPSDVSRASLLHIACLNGVSLLIALLLLLECKELLYYYC